MALSAAQKRVAPKSMIQLIPMQTLSGEALAGHDFGEIVDLALDDQRILFVCDGRAGNIKKFDSTGYIGVIGQAGPGPGKLEKPVEIEVFRGRVFVRERGGSRIAVFAAEGKFLSSIPIDDKDGSWRKFRVLPDGRFIVETDFIDRANANAPLETRLTLYDANFARLRTIYRNPVRRSKIISPSARTSVLLPFAPVVEWDLTPEGMIVIGYSGDYAIEIFDPDNGEINSWVHPFMPVEITAKDREQYLSGLGRGVPNEIRKTIEFPKTKPAFEQFLVNGRGRIWAFLPPIDSGAKPIFEAFDPAGTFQGRVECENEWPRSAPVVFFQGGVWIATAGEDGRWRIVRYRITS